MRRYRVFVEDDELDIVRDDLNGGWVKWEDIAPKLELVKADLDRAIEQQTKFTPWIKSYCLLKELLDTNN